MSSFNLLSFMRQEVLSWIGYMHGWTVLQNYYLISSKLINLYNALKLKGKKTRHRKSHRGPKAYTYALLLAGNDSVGYVYTGLIR